MEAVTPTPQKLVDNPFRDIKYDQFALMDQTGNTIYSSRMMRILRYLRGHSPIREGNLAGQCLERVFNPEWQYFIELLTKWKWIQLTPGKHGRSMEVSLTELGEEFLHERLDPRPAPEQPAEVTNGIVNA